MFGDSGQEFTFKLYDHSIEQELDLYSPPAILFNEEGYGNKANPYILNFKTTPTYTITIDANPVSGGTISGGGDYDSGTSCTLTATPNTGYHFVNWTKDGTQVSTDASYTFIVTENATYVANFMLNCYTIGVSASPSDGGTATGSGAYDYGSSCTVTATANPGYTFMYWKENDEVVSTNANYNFTVTGERNLVAHFALPFTISATASPAEGGTVSGGGAFDYGTTCNMTATANPGYTFMYWKEGDEIVSNEANYSFTVTGERNLVAHFALPFTITVTANPTEGGTVSGGGTFNYGANCTLIATANTGYTFTNWTKDGVVVSTQSHYSFAASESGNYVANFALNNYSIAVRANPAEGGVVSFEGGSPNRDASPWQSEAYPHGATVTVNATPNEGYLFVNWTEGSTVVTTEPEYSFVATCERYLTANFSEAYTVSASINPEFGGTVTGAGTYPAGSSCTLTATPNAGYTFANWSIGATAITTSPTYSFTVNGNRTMVANFNYQGYHFVTEGAWNNPDNWMPVGVPTNTDDVYIEASVTIPNECVALANEITVINPAANITIAEGGQLITSNAVDGTIQKSITGYGEGEDSYYFIASPVDNFNPNDGGLLTVNYDLYYFDQTQEGEEWRNYEAASFNLNTGEGYLYASQTDVTLNITGELTATKAPIALANETGAAFEGWNLIGNPYPCNVTINVPFYRMDSDGSGLAAQTTSLETTAIKPMEGVFVQYTTEAPSVTFTKAPNVSATGSRGALNLSLSQGRGLKDNAIIRFDGGKTLEKFSLRKGGSSIFIPHEGKDYAVVNAGKHGDIPFSFKAGENGSYTLSFSNEDVTFDYLHLIDNMTGNDVDLLANPNYSFEAMTTDYASRFRLVFSTGSNANDKTFAFFSNGSFVINNEGNATLQVVDVMGRILRSETINGSANVNVNAAPGVYVLRLIHGDNVRTQKVVVK